MILEKKQDYVFGIPKTHKTGMLVEGVIYATADNWLMG